MMFEKKFVKWQNIRNESCDFTEKIMSKYVLLKLADNKWQLAKVNENLENWQCAFQKIWTLIVKDTLWNILTFTDDASDAYIDKVLENLRQAIADNGLDPADLPNGEVGFSETILGITFHGKAEVHDGFFQGTG